MTSTYEQLLAILDAASATYRLIDHEPEGKTDRASSARGHDLRQAAKSIVVEIKESNDRRRYVLAVVPGDLNVDLHKMRKLFHGADARMADRQTAERLSGCVSGCIVPFSFSEELISVFDSILLDQKELYFNAARLDRSIAIDVTSFRRAAGNVLVESISRMPR